VTKEQRIENLALSFPSIRSNVEAGYLPGVSPWDPSDFDDYRRNPTMEHGSGMRSVIDFIWHVWSGENCFSLRTAFGRWDRSHTAAWKAWASKPWWA
jgi:hypothetical protein